MFPAIPHLLLHVPLPGFTGLRGQDVHTFLHLGSVDGDGQEGITALEKLPRSPKLDSQSTQEVATLGAGRTEGSGGTANQGVMSFLSCSRMKERTWISLYQEGA